MYIHLRNHSESCYFFGTAKHNLTARDLGEVTTKNVVYLNAREKANVEKSIDNVEHSSTHKTSNLS